ncbi:hypothetical protein MNBD_GAMMA09-276 [hydrothermal vent metagenome]|uniref:Uncharacterized protein n=1 Tax=hydrothermal vent metagenome TaxID=652676 RepID=A0A3B0XFD8_9ZZZZ
MKFSEDYAIGSYVIHSYSDNGIEINNALYSKSLLISNNSLNTDWKINHIEQMGHSDWHSLLELKPEVILIGTGRELIFPPPSTYAPVIEQGIGIEFMNSNAACRTYNVLLSEDRRVVAGIIL